MSNKNELIPVELPEDYSGIDLEVAGYHSLSLRDRQIALLCVVKGSTGQSYTQIAKEFGISLPRLNQIRQKKDFKEFETYLTEQIFADLFTDVVMELRDIMKNEKSRSLKVKVAQLVLQSQGRLKQEHRHELKQEKPQTLDDLEFQVLEMERDLLED